MKQEKKAKPEWREWLEALIIAAAIAYFVVRPFIIQAYKIPSGSMRPTFIEGDIILVNKFIYGPKVPFTDLRLPGVRPPQRGDIVVFISPPEPHKDFIKRLVATEGETVEIKNGTIYIDDRPLLDSVFNQFYYYNRGEFGREGQKIIVPKDSFFVLGDNSASSQDSRYWGFVPYKNLLGKALIVYWPLPRIRIIK